MAEVRVLTSELMNPAEYPAFLHNGTQWVRLPMRLVMAAASEAIRHDATARDWIALAAVEASQEDLDLAWRIAEAMSAAVVDELGRRSEHEQQEEARG